MSQGKVSRRNFLTKLLSLPFLGFLSTWLPVTSKPAMASDPLEVSRIISVFHSGATDNTDRKDNENLNQAVITDMVNRGVMAFTQTDSTLKAWQLIIPDSSKKVAIKVNCQIKGIYTKSRVVEPITAGLLSIGVKPENIFIYDMTENAFELAGFRKNSGEGVQVGTVKDFGGYARFCFDRLANLLVGGHDNSILNYLAKVNRETSLSSVRWSCEQILDGASRPFDCDYLINVPVLKALDGYSGVTLSMKNHYGSFGNPADHHEDIMDWIPYVNSRPEIREKTRLIVMDGIFVEYQWINGRDQKYVDHCNKILVSNDPVAMDYTGWNLIEEKRKEHNLGPLVPQPDFIEKAAQAGLGNNRPDQIEHIEMVLA